MGFFSELGKKVTDAGQKTVQKTKEISEVAHVNSLISQNENKINNAYFQIGKLYVSIHGNDGEEEFEGLVSMIAELEQQIVIYRKQIQDIKGIQHCEKCGAEVPKGVAFCSSCGNAMPKVEMQENFDDCVRCASCGAMVKKGMRFCTSCGQSMTPLTVSEVVTTQSQDNMIETEEKNVENVCPNCGAKLDCDSVFCTECGTKL